jgi:hypothetical protein
MINEMMASIKDPAAMQKKQDEFGCHTIRAIPDAAGKVTGTIGCGRLVGNPQITGTLTFVR